MARASAAPLPYHDRDSARLRLSWRAVPERIEVCREVSAAELAERGEHMRQRVDCDGRSATYVLRVEADGRILHESVVRGSGLRHDRPLYVLRDFVLAGGEHRVRVTFARRERPEGATAAAPPPAPPPPPATDADTGVFAGRARREADERVRRARAAVPALLVLDTSLTFTQARVTLVTFDAGRRQLLARQTSPSQ